MLSFLFLFSLSDLFPIQSVDSAWSIRATLRRHPTQIRRFHLLKSICPAKLREIQLSECIDNIWFFRVLSRMQRICQDVLVRFPQSQLARSVPALNKTPAGAAD